MKDLPKISEAEWEVMKILWSKSPQTANEVIDALEGQKEWKPKTVRTLISRLLQKKVISYHQETSKTYLYYPLVSQDDYLQAETQSFLKRLYGGALKPLLVNFLQEQKLSSEEINELKRILDDKIETELKTDRRKDR
ncbi:BlaI/MecI/CopY family transcriptional regulator [Aneurinibacillus migulanus]|uniref:Beta-lactamase repressor n=1 Tax=Aneurinibacillus migulanus TaxID=47500 RepID=A0A0D1WFB9_ANEMI|nr:BlaI/MecI/CopY family transcriptional regulator [Aneurinibacillus migulanus]KIV57210.1 beta-lactamase repressor [Aneurinibacillus migulanus]KON96897.1 beta-lactamase repressor [Aneurinibacillus migulanus]MED0894258.1 BlaI/MecI/CopY family transcriptional regulator [Aneurinibacillus migulanus]MED1619531.1 BlaI/MecI/CopY family transcriptional regulator [Aneurinibacillus migulanus]SDJ69456.1 BlaI family transcriptional regulator, penicillinase repressor [Aneurinibacillus migulanus]